MSGGSGNHGDVSSFQAGQGGHAAATTKRARVEDGMFVHVRTPAQVEEAWEVLDRLRGRCLKKLARVVSTTTDGRVGTLVDDLEGMVCLYASEGAGHTLGTVWLDECDVDHDAIAPADQKALRRACTAFQRTPLATLFPPVPSVPPAPLVPLVPPPKDV